MFLFRFFVENVLVRGFVAWPRIYNEVKVVGRLERHQLRDSPAVSEVSEYKGMVGGLMLGVIDRVMRRWRKRTTIAVHQAKARADWENGLSRQRLQGCVSWFIVPPMLVLVPWIWGCRR